MIGVLERYILRTGTVAFAGALVVLTAVIWLTQALKEFDLLTLKGQSLLIFLLHSTIEHESLEQGVQISFNTLLTCM